MLSRSFTKQRKASADDQWLDTGIQFEVSNATTASCLRRPKLPLRNTVRVFQNEKKDC